MTRVFLFLAVIAATLAVPDRWDGRAGPAMAWADDHGDDGDDDGDGDSDDDGGDDDGPRGGRAGDDDDDDDVPRAVPRSRGIAPPPATLPAPRPARAPGEVLVRGLDEAALAALEARGYRELRRSTLADGTRLHRLRPPRGTGADRARTELRELARGRPADFNHYYRTDAGPACTEVDCLARNSIAWPQEVACGGAPPRVGMIDTAINTAHEALASARLTVLRLPGAGDASKPVHGTAVAALLVGAADGRAPGLVPHVELVAVDAFATVDGDVHADAMAVVEALDRLAAEGVRVINLSFSGPDNAVLAEAVADMERRGILLIAAAGNRGPAAEPGYPAAYDTVLAVTAVDRRGEVYRRAGRGAHIDLAAPGVDVWTAASIRGARTKTGTSFAAPFVTAAAALVLQERPGTRPSELRAALLSGGRDLGADGRDDVYGHGLVSPVAVCRGGRSGAPAAGSGPGAAGPPAGPAGR